MSSLAPSGTLCVFVDEITQSLLLSHMAFLYRISLFERFNDDDNTLMSAHDEYSLVRMQTTNEIVVLYIYTIIDPILFSMQTDRIRTQGYDLL